MICGMDLRPALPRPRVIWMYPEGGATCADMVGKTYTYEQVYTDHGVTYQWTGVPCTLDPDWPGMVRFDLDQAATHTILRG